MREKQDVRMGGSACFPCDAGGEVPVSCEVRVSGLRGSRGRAVLLRVRPARAAGGAAQPYRGGGFRRRAHMRPGPGGTATALVEGTVSFPPGADAGACVVEARRPLAGPAALALALLLLAALAAAVLTDPWGDPRAKAGYYEGKPDEEVQRDLAEQVDWYSMQMSCAPYVVMSPGSTLATGVNIENIGANHCDQKVTVTLKDTGEVLFESGAISPGEYIGDAEFSRSFGEGAYEALVEFQGYEREARVGGGGRLWGHDEFGAPSRLEMLVIVTDDEAVARSTAAYYLEHGTTGAPEADEGSAP